MELGREELDVAARSALFLGLERQEVLTLLRGCAPQLRHYARGEIIYRPRAFTRSLGILLTGSIAVSKGEFPVNRLRAGELFGAAALYNEEPDYVTTLTACSACRVLLLEEGAVERLLDVSPRVRDNYLRYLSGRIRFLNAKLEALTGPTAEERLLRYLEQRERAGRTGAECSLSELARRLGMGRASLYRVLERMERRGILVRDGKSIALLNKKG